MQHRLCSNISFVFTNFKNNFEQEKCDDPDPIFGCRNYEYETENPENLPDNDPTEVQRFCSLPFLLYTSLFNEFGTCY